MRSMDFLLANLTAHISYWPLVAFLVLIPAGFNLPISEDAVIILSAAVAQADHKILLPTYAGLFAGIFLSDIICYYFGRVTSKGALKFRKIRGKLTKERLSIIKHELNKNGFKTFIICRFIPFGVRNLLFTSSGFVHLGIKKFVLFDSIAVLISSSTLYFLVFAVGESASVCFKVVGITLFVMLIAAMAFIVIKKVRQYRNTDESSEEEEAVAL